MLGYIAKNLAVNANPIKVLSDYLEYRNTVEQNVTAREEIKAKRDVAIEVIRAQEKIILEYFEKRFKERKDALQNFFQLLWKAVESKDEIQLDVALTGILGVIKDNPLGDFENFKKNMLKSDYKIEL